MDPLCALDTFEVGGPPLRRWEAVVLSALRHGESTVTAALWLCLQLRDRGGRAGLGCAGHVRVLRHRREHRTADVDVAGPLVALHVGAGLVSIEFRWWRWLVSRGTHGRHRRYWLCPCAPSRASVPYSDQDRRSSRCRMIAGFSPNMSALMS